MTRLNGFNSIAWAYDTLSRIVFGGSILRAQQYFLHRLPPKGKVLIIGGGTGEILAELFRLRPHLEVWFVEASSAMIKKAQSRIKQSNRVIFIHSTEADIPADRTFDVAITNFFLDLFPTATLSDVIGKIDVVVQQGGLWLATDFCNNDGRLWKTVMLKIMYLFFRLTAGIGAKSLPKWEVALQAKGYSIKESRQFYGGFICSLVLIKN